MLFRSKAEIEKLLAGKKGWKLEDDPGDLKVHPITAVNQFFVDLYSRILFPVCLLYNFFYSTIITYGSNVFSFSSSIAFSGSLSLLNQRLYRYSPKPDRSILKFVSHLLFMTQE